ncbi:MAG: EthD domain-containing protein [Akkermansiaceae bacterium]
MIKFVYCVRKNPEMSDEEFRDYWLNNHGPLVKSVAETLQAKKYVQSHTIATPLNEVAQAPRMSKPPYDGITEVWWESHEALAAIVQTPEAQQALGTLVQDESRFCDLPNCSVFLTEEHTIFE